HGRIAQLEERGPYKAEVPGSIPGPPTTEIPPETDSYPGPSPFQTSSTRSGRLLEAHHAVWPTLLAMGETAAAVPHMERGIAIYRKEEHASQAFLYAGHDPGACCRYQQAIVQWLLGYPERAATLIRDAQHLSDQLRHPFTGTATLWSSAWLHYQRGEREAAARTSLRMRELAETHGIVHWLDASIVVPHIAASRGLDARALAEMHPELMGVGRA